MSRHGQVINTADHEFTTLIDPPCTCNISNAGPNTVPEPIKPALVQVKQLKPGPKAPAFTPKKILTRPPPTAKTERVAHIAHIGAAPFRTASHQKGSKVFTTTMQEIMEISAKTPEFDLSLLPEEFHQFKDVFSRVAADKLPEQRKYDHKIQLNEGASPEQIGTARLYRMSEKELIAVKDYITENFNKGFIDSSKAPFASPVLFVRKKNGDLRFCVDYRRLNAITKKDKYPLPLIEETLAQLTGAKFISKIDIRHAFNRIRMSEESEELTTFTTAFGTYKYKVMPFGLCNGPASFQHYMNDILWEGLNRWCAAYMDDIIIYSLTREEHITHVRWVLEQLQEAGLQADISKCEFFTTETKFLGLIVTTKGIKVDPEKVKTIVDWEVPTCVADVRGFLGFCNFYRRFMRGFSKTVRALVELTRKDQVFGWTPACQQAFDQVKALITTAPVLRHFDRLRTCYVECDASDYVTAGVLSQKDDDGILHPVAFFSRKMAPAECNYEIYDKELLAIIRCFEEWRPDLEGTDLPVQVLTDHKSLEYFMTTKRLTRRQARWAEFLADYHFQITYRPGKQNDKADALTRRGSDQPGNPEDERQKYMQQTLLPVNRLHPSLVEGRVEEVGEASITFTEKLRAAQSKDQLCRETLKQLDEGERVSRKLSLGHCSQNQGLLCYQNRFWIPESMRTDLIKEVHTQPLVGHPGVAKTLALLKRQFYWPRMDKEVLRYVNNCHDCRRAKAFTDTYNGVLIPLPIPQQPWQDLSLDFVTGLPTDQGQDTILVVVCRLTKERHYIPCSGADSGTTAEATARLFVQHIIRLHGLPDTVISDRGPQFVSEFWKHLCRILKIDSRLSTAVHPESDGQTEISNKEMERYLRTYVDYLQDNWVEFLPLAEFAVNNAVSSTTLVSPFFATRGYHPRMSFDIDPEVKEPKHPRDITERKRADQTASKLREVWEFVREQIGLAQTRMEHFADASRKPAPAYQPGDKVWLSSRNLRTQRPSKKLDSKNLGPFKVLEKVGATSYRLQLPASMQIHPVFHSNLLRLDPDNPLPGQVQEPPPPIEIEGEEEFEVSKIKDSRRYRGRLQYRVDWMGYPPDDVWYNAENFENSPDLVREFHAKYPRKPGIRN